MFPEVFIPIKHPFSETDKWRLLLSLISFTTSKILISGKATANGFVITVSSLVVERFFHVDYPVHQIPFCKHPAGLRSRITTIEPTLLWHMNFTASEAFEL